MEPPRRLSGLMLLAAFLAMVLGPALMDDRGSGSPPSALLPDSGSFASGGVFVENAGQLSNPDVRFYQWSGSGAIGFGEGFVLLRVVGTEGSTFARVTFEGARPVAPVGRGELPHRTAFFVGSDPANWRTAVRSYGEVAYVGLYDDIDLVYRSTPEGLKYDFIVHPGGNPRDIALRYEAADLDVSPAQVTVRTAAGELRDTSIVGFQGGRRVPCAFVPKSRQTYGFACDAWDPREDLVIDPLLYSTYFGGATGGGGGRDTPLGLAVDAAGDLYAVGETESPDFPTTPGAYDATLDGTSDAFLVKLRPGGNGPADLLYSVFLGGGQMDRGQDVWVDTAGDVYVAGRTWSPDFPTTPGAFDATANVTVTDGFLAVLRLDGNGPADLRYGTYLGGAGNDEVRGLAVDDRGYVYLCGLTEAPDFPTTTGAYNTALNGSYDAFLVLLDPAGAGPADLVYATYLGDTDGDYCYDIALDGRRAFLTGHTYSSDFPTTAGAFNATFSGAWDGIFAVIAPNGAGSADLEYGTLFGAATPYGIAVHGGDAYITGYTSSPSFPVTPGAFDVAYNASSDGFVVQFSPAGGGASDLRYGTYLGGSGIENPAAIAVDAAGNAYVTGQTGSAGFPVTPDAFQGSSGGTEDAFLTKFIPAGFGAGDLDYSTFFGGGGEDEGWGVAVDAAGDVYLAVRTFMGIFPTTPGAYSEGPVGSVDVVLVKLGLGPNTPPVADAGPDGAGTRNVTAFLDGSGSYDPDGVPLRFAWTLTSGPGPATIANATKARASFVPTRLGTYVFNLTVRDGDGAPAYDSVNVSVANVPPTAQLIVLPSSPRVGETATVNASASFDSDGSIAEYNFTFGDGSGMESVLGVVAHAWSSAGVHQVNVTVTDGDGATDTDTLPVTVLANQAPIADAGPDATYLKNRTVTLNGTASYDPEGDPITFAWLQVGGPSVSLTGAATASPSVFLPRSGVYVFQLWVNDSFGGSGTDVVQLTATNTVPVADAGPDVSVPRGVLVGLDGRDSSDGDGDLLSFSWTQTAGPPVVLSNADTSVAMFMTTALGTYVFELMVDDGDGGTDVDSATVVVFNHAPIIASAMPTTSTVTGLEGGEFSFSVAALDPDGDVIAFTWTVNGTVQSSAIASFAFVPSTAGTYVVNVTVSDGNLTDDHSWTVIVRKPGPVTPPSPAGLFVLVGVVVVGMILLAAVILWGRRKRPAPADTTDGARPDE